MKQLSLKPYVIGFFLSVVLTLGAYLLTLIHVQSYHQTIPHELLIPILLVFAFLQLVVQLVFFLHLWQEKKPHWNLVFFLSTFALVLLVVVMSLWIMQHLNTNMTPTDMTNTILQDEGIHH